MTSRIFWSLLAVSILAFAPALHAAKKPRIAVLELAQRGTQEEGEAIAEELRKAFVKSGRYVVIDRTLTAQILKEWETQQSGLTEGEKAIKIGRLFNVQLIVSGKLNKFSAGGWQVSVVMLDAQTGVAIKAETVRHRGDFFSLLDEKVPQLAVALVNEPAAPPPAATGPAPSRRNIRPSGAGKKLALFPPRVAGIFAESGPELYDPVVGAIRRMIRESYGGRLNISHVFNRYEVKEYEKLKSGYADVFKHSWEGFIFLEPNKDFISGTAEKLGVDAVVLLFFSVDDSTRGGNPYRLYLYRVANRKLYAKFGDWGGQTAPLEKAIIAPLRELLKVYR